MNVCRPGNKPVPIRYSGARGRKIKQNCLAAGLLLDIGACEKSVKKNKIRRFFSRRSFCIDLEA